MKREYYLLEILIEKKMSLFFGNMLDKFKALLLVWRYPCLKEDRIRAVLCVEKWVITVDLNEEVDALVTLVEVRIFFGEWDWAARTSVSNKHDG